MKAPVALRRVGLGFLVGVALSALAAGAFAWVLAADPEQPAIVEVQFAGEKAIATGLLNGDAPIEDLRTSVRRDWLLIPAYVAALGWWGLYGWCHFRMRSTRVLAGVLAVAVVLAGALDAGENVLTNELLDQRGANEAMAQWVTTLALPKWLILFAVVPFALAALSTGLARLVRRCRRADPCRRPALSTGPVAALLGPVQKDRCEWNSTVPGPLKHPARSPRVGVCFSGGGIRSATFNMGVLQELSRVPVPSGIPAANAGSLLERTDYLSCVSGGAYIAGALQLLAHQHRTDDSPPTFALCSPEENHVRLHGRYLADTAGQWMGAMACVLSGTLLNLLVFTLLLFVVARPLGWLQHELLFHVTEGVNELNTTSAMWWSVGLAAGVGLVLLLGATLVTGDAGVVRQRVQLVAYAFFALALLLLLLVWLLPTLARVMPEWIDKLGGWLPWADEAPERGGGTVLVVTAGGSLAASALAIINRPAPKSESAKAPKWPAFSALRKWMGAALPYVAGLLLVAIALVAFATFLSQAALAGTAKTETFFGIDERLEVPVWTGTATLLVGLFLFADQTRWSLGPFYRRRLASAFAITVEDGKARELDWKQPTTISEVAQPHPKLPEVLVCAAANVSGQVTAPPGRRATSFVFGAEYVGGPAVGWARTTDFEAACRGAIRSDSTFLSAMAISGAAFASAMGRHSKGSINSLLAASNARLGIWLPSPHYIAELSGQVPEPQYESSEDPPSVYEGAWLKRRRFSYLLKELFGSYSTEDRLLYLTDGGHYENLGLVELFRRRCRLILCFDASGDDLVTCGTFVEAVALAKEELDVEVTIDISPLAPRKADESAAGARTALNGRLSARSVVVGSIRYSDYNEGVLVLAKASLTAGTPTAVLAHAARQKKPTFPNDSTGDQFFDHSQFNAYSELGRHIARQVVEDLQRVVLPPRPPGAAPDTSARRRR